MSELDFVSCIASAFIIFAVSLAQVRASARAAFARLDLTTGAAPGMCDEVRKILQGAQYRALLWPILVTVVAFGLSALGWRTPSLRPVLLGPLPKAAVDAIEYNFGHNDWAAAGAIALTLFVIVQVPSLTTTDEAQDASWVSRFVGFYRFWRRRYVEAVVLRGKRDRVLAALANDMVSEWFPPLPSTGGPGLAEATMVNEGRGQAIATLEDEVGAPHGSSAMQVVTSALDELGWDYVYEVFAERQRAVRERAGDSCAASRGYRAKIRRAWNIGAELPDHANACVAAAGFADWYRVDTLDIDEDSLRGEPITSDGYFPLRLGGANGTEVKAAPKDNGTRQYLVVEAPYARRVARKYAQG